MEVVVGALFLLHTAESALTALITATVRAFMAAQTEGADAIAASVTDVP